jgi:hypothetical protein
MEQLPTSEDFLNVAARFTHIKKGPQVINHVQMIATIISILRQINHFTPSHFIFKINFNIILSYSEIKLHRKHGNQWL